MTKRKIGDFPSTEQCAHMGIGEIIGFFTGTKHENDPRIKRFRMAADSVMDLLYEAHAEEELAAGETCTSCMESAAHAAGWTTLDGKTWVHSTTGEVIANRAALAARLMEEGKA